MENIADPHIKNIQEYNLNLSLTKKVPVGFHNLQI